MQARLLMQARLCMEQGCGRVHKNSGVLCKPRLFLASVLVQKGCLNCDLSPLGLKARVRLLEPYLCSDWPFIRICIYEYLAKFRVEHASVARALGLRVLQ
jgi:hypothetical protein